jgi:hypothetical protein
LTFLLVEFFWEVDLREQMLGFFGRYFLKEAGAPVQVLIEPVIR